MKQGQNIVFIIGAPRSGTTWLQKILSVHSAVVTGQESEFFTSFAEPVLRNFYSQLHSPSERGGTGLPCYFTEKSLYELLANTFYRMIEVVPEYNENMIFLEKTPSHALVCDLIDRVLPKARFIHIVRDPRDVVESLNAAARSWGKVWAPRTAYGAICMWKRHVASARRCLERLPTDRQLEIHYEDLRDDPANVVCEIVDRLQLPIERHEARCLHKKSKYMELKKYGEFGLRWGAVVQEPEGFVRRQSERKKRGVARKIKRAIVGAVLYRDIRKRVHP